MSVVIKNKKLRFADTGIKVADMEISGHQLQTKTMGIYAKESV